MAPLSVFETGADIEIQAAKDLNDEYGVDPRRTASLLDVFSCGFQGLVPYGGQLLSAAAIAGISPLAITPYSWYPILILVIAILTILFNISRFGSGKSTFSQ